MDRTCGFCHRVETARVNGVDRKNWGISICPTCNTHKCINNQNDIRNGLQIACYQRVCYVCRKLSCMSCMFDRTCCSKACKREYVTSDKYYPPP